MCCTFNMKAADEIFNGKTYSDLVKTLQAQDQNSTFKDSSRPISYQNEPVSRPGVNFSNSNSCSWKINWTIFGSFQKISDFVGKFSRFSLAFKNTIVAKIYFRNKQRTSAHTGCSYWSCFAWFDWLWLPIIYRIGHKQW